ncbi:MAG: hypothetical protein V6Z86_01140 [Hyphomicrobiales bacterium]
MNEKMVRIIDFYFACPDSSVYDIAVCMNAWCFKCDGSFNKAKACALVQAYENKHPLSREECEAMPVLAHGAAMRFSPRELMTDLPLRGVRQR